MSSVAHRPLRVVVWSTGTLGRHAVAGVDAHPAMELVGVWVHDPAKVGRDAGDLAGLGRQVGVAATDDRAALMALRPDAIVHAAMTDHRPFAAIEDLIAFLDAGINVVSSGPVMLQWPTGIVSPEVVQRIQDVGARTGASLHVNGIDPGFANDVLPLALSSVCRRIDQIRVLEIADYATYLQPFVMGELFGFGRPLQEPGALFAPGVLSMAWGGVVRQIAAGLDLTLDEPLVEDVQWHAAERDVQTASLPIPTGTTAAVRFTVSGLVDGQPRVVLEHVTRTAADQAPDWPQPPVGDGSYRVEITGEPMLHCDLVHQGEHGDHNVSGMIMTAQRLVNALPHVVAGEGGLLTALDLPLVTARGLVAL